MSNISFVSENLTYWPMFRSMRNNDLLLSDWTQLPDVVMDDQTRDSWKVYRQQLRDITSNVKDPYLFVSLPKPNWLWPCPPGQTPILPPPDFDSTNIFYQPVQPSIDLNSSNQSVLPPLDLNSNQSVLPPLDLNSNL